MALDTIALVIERHRDLYGNGCGNAFYDIPNKDY